MPTLLPPTPAEDRPLWGPEETSCAQGNVGQSVYSQLEEVLRHWNSRLAPELHNGNVPDLDQDLAYEPVPPNRTFQVPTRYVYQGKGEPLPYNYDLE